MTDNDFDPIGNILNDKYIVLCYIGCGTFSSVWLGYDIEKNFYNTLKILPAKNLEYGDKELYVLTQISSHDNPYLNKLLDNFIFKFEENEYNCLVFNLMAGSLQDVLNMDKYKNGLPTQIAKIMMKQILQGLQILHEKCNIIHADIKPENILLKGQSLKITKFIQLLESATLYKKTCNIIQNYKISHQKKDMQIIKKNIRNIITNIYTDFDNEILSSDKMCDILNIFDDNNSTNDDGDENSNTYSNDSTEKSSYTTISDRTSDHGEIDIYLDNISNVSSSFSDRFLCEKNCTMNSYHNDNSDSNDSCFNDENENFIDDNFILINPQICVADFGNCYNIDNITRGDLQTRYYRSPEIILRLDITCACDIWALGCLFYELLTGKLLFKPSKTKFINRDKSHIYEIHRKICIIPEYIVNKSRKKYIFFRKDGTIKNLYCFVSSPFSLKLQKILLNNNNCSETIICNDPFLTHTHTKIISLLQSMLDPDYNLRYTAQQCLNHILFDD